jgi:hypothetical protein
MDVDKEDDGCYCILLPPCTVLQVTVGVPGGGDLQLAVPVDVTGPQLLQMVQQAAAAPADAAAKAASGAADGAAEPEADSDFEEGVQLPSAAAAEEEEDEHPAKRQHC